ncbi:aldo/keto reductase [Flavobacterium sp. MDT1-60]|uniref:aldo/keto reductase n=1 Tax=Flavobacterium sp. MDT1-60 TaxID=1979344 RepID=UPI00177F5634|nr:aldo/keto reductase [Flavobacterium sp. MDT1-60]QOG01304.1 aldo/keto reductase [Flavobacterium sp. MDT1-60]
MKYKIFGQKTGLRVSELALGTGNFGTRWGHGSDEETSKNIFNKYIEAGGNFIDTADGYQVGQSEEILGNLIKEKRHDLILSSKFSTGGSTLLTTGNSRKNIIHSVEQSLKRLDTDYLDIYWAHLSDGQTPIEEIMRAMDDLVRQGKILYTGFSNFPAWKIANAALLADLRGWAPVAGIQIEYNLIERGADRELLPMAESLGLGAAFWSPLAGGTLTGKYRSNLQNEPSRQQAWGGALLKGENGNRETEILNALENIANEKEVKILDIALAWLRQKHDNSGLSTVTILGPRNEQQLVDNLNSLNITLSEQEIELLNKLSTIDLGYPHSMISESQKSIFGESTGLVEVKHKV